MGIFGSLSTWQCPSWVVVADARQMCVDSHWFGVHTRVHLMLSAVLLQNFMSLLLTLSSEVSKEVVSTFLAQTLSVSGRARENVIYISADLNLTACPSQSSF